MTILYDDMGYISGGPITPAKWRAVAPEMPAGQIVTNNSVPPGMLIIQNFLAPAFCDALVAECERVSGVQHTVSDVGAENEASAMTKSATRSSEFIDIRKLTVDVTGVVRQVFAGAVGPYFRREIDWFELPEILRYRAGGEYKPHADADNWRPEEKKWKRTLDRDLSILLYLNEGFGGGEIDFPNFALKLAPKRGLLIAFPSDARYVHAARPVTSGIRYALVSWAAVKGGARVNNAPRPHSIRM